VNKPFRGGWGLLLSLILMCAPLLALVKAAPPAPALNAAAPSFTLAGQKGSLSLESLRGRVVLLDFWASWCAPCAQSFPWLEGLHHRFREQGLTVLGVNVDKQRKKADAFLSLHATTFPVVFDPKGEVAAAYALPGMPTTCFIDRQGRLRRIHTGFRPEEVGAVEAFIEELLKEKAPAAPAESPTPVAP